MLIPKNLNPFFFTPQSPSFQFKSHAMENIAINSIIKTLSKNDSSVVLLWGSNPHHSILY